ncbi:MAG: hypothetical protein EOO42_01105 [Flavobacteriales bacterium]|nr:MAG: hypothetical protein EOO42_01105 [Flavobacteriales bacterium]
MLKSTKRFLLTSEKKNNQGFKVRTSGIDLTDFYNNPIMLFMHERPKGLSTNEVLPLGFWDDIEITNDGKIYATPVFDDTDDFAVKIYNKVENGTIKMASAGLAPGSFNDNPEDLWLETSIGVEFSIVDRGSNSEALSSSIALYNKTNELVTLSDINSIINLTKSSEMKLIQLSAATAALLLLKDGATETEAHTAIEKLVTLAATNKTEIETLTKEKGELAAAKIEVETKLEAAVKLAGEEKVIALVDNAINVDRKITADLKDDYIKLGYDVAKSLLDKMPANPTIIKQLEKETGAGDKTLLTMSYKELDKAGKLLTLKAQDFEVFKTKFKEEYNTDYAGAQ